MRFAPCLLVLALAACKIHRLPELPPDRDPVSVEAPVTDYDPPPDVLTKELSTGAKDDGADPHAGHHRHHGPAAEPAPAKVPAPSEAPAPAETPASQEHDHDHGGPK